MVTRVDDGRYEPGVITLLDLQTSPPGGYTVGEDDAPLTSVENLTRT